VSQSVDTGVMLERDEVATPPAVPQTTNADTDTPLTVHAEVEQDDGMQEDMPCVFELSRSLIARR
jgi:hypothetical protein